MPAPGDAVAAGSLLDQTYRLVVARQMSYGAELGVPWGMSESGFNARDLAQAYQYSGFGVPGLGLKRGLERGCGRRPVRDGARRRWSARGRRYGTSRACETPERPAPGLREALDYTARRLPKVRRSPSSELHGPSPGDDPRRYRQRPQRRCDAWRASTPTRSSRRPSCCSRSGCRATSPVVRPRAEEVKSAADVRDLVPPSPPPLHAPRTTRRRGRTSCRTGGTRS